MRKTGITALRGGFIGAIWTVLLVLLLQTAPAAEVCAGSATENSSSTSAAYKLGTLDKIRLKVFEWRAATDEIFPWDALNEEYVVGPSGQIGLPLVGEIPAAGLTTLELAKSVTDKIQQKMGLSSPPSTTVEIVEYRPFFVVGAVEKPGRYPCQPGLNVINAVGIAGGLLRPKDPGILRSERDAITSRGDLALHIAEQTRLLLTEARLNAELSNTDTIQFPQFKADDQRLSLIEGLKRQEEKLFHGRRKTYKTQMDALQQLKKYLDLQIVTLRDHKKTHDSETENLKNELGKLRGLSSTGLATSSRLIEVGHLLTEAVSNGLRIEEDLLKAQQESSRTGLEIIEFENRRSSELLLEMQAATSALDTVAKKINTDQRLIYEAEVLAPAQIASAEKDLYKPVVRYSILRNNDKETVELQGVEKTAVLPGDTIKVELLRPKEWLEPSTANAGPQIPGTVFK
jgi:protein involved in polysaccharide export with SLBB domain